MLHCCKINCGVCTLSDTLHPMYSKYCTAKCAHSLRSNAEAFYSSCSIYGGKEVLAFRGGGSMQKVGGGTAEGSAEV